MIYYYPVSAAAFGEIIKAAQTAYAVYQSANAAQEEAREQYDSGNISQAALMEANAAHDAKVDAAQKKAIADISAARARIMTDLEAADRIDPADMDKADFRILQTDLLKSRADLIALKQRNMESNIIRAEVERFAFDPVRCEDFKPLNVFANLTSRADVLEALNAIMNAAACVLGDTSCKGSYIAAFLDTIKEPDEQTAWLQRVGVLPC